MNLALWLYRAGLSHPSLPAAASGTRVVATYGELAARAARLAGALRDRLRLSPGDRVAIAAKNSPDYLALLYGIWHAGLAAVPANAKLHGAELGYILEQSGARVCFASPGIDSEIAPHAPKSLERLITIGSAEYEALFAADPIAVVPRARRRSRLAVLHLRHHRAAEGRHAHASTCWSLASHAYAAEVDPVTPGDAILHAAPDEPRLRHLHHAHVARLGVQVVPESGGFEPEEVFALFNAWPRMSMFAAPTMIKRLVACPADCNAENIRTLIWGGAPMYVEDALAALDRFGPRLAQIYGQGEAPMTITTLSKQDIADRDHPRWRERLGSAGKPYACVEVMVADARGHARGGGRDRRNSLPRRRDHGGLLAKPEAHARPRLRGGWLHTGDVGVFDAEGYLHLKDRSKDLIISGGSNIYPREVEEVLLTHGAVREVSVIGRPDREWGEVVVAYVVGEAPAQPNSTRCV